MSAPANIKPDPARVIAQLLQSQKAQIRFALPQNTSMTPERMTRIAVTEVRKTPALLKCDPLSILAAIIQCAQLGLEPGSALGHVYLIPFGNQVQVVIGYRGMIELARRSGQIESIGAYCVYERDKFELALGLDPNIKHVPEWKGDHGPIVAVYSVAKLKGGGVQFEIMSKEQVDTIMRDALKGRGNTPWHNYYDEMARKTAIRRLFKYLPISVEMAKAMELDDHGEEPLEITNFETGEPLTLEVPQTSPSTDEVKRHQRLEAIRVAWFDMIELGEEPEKLLRMTEADLAAANESKQESALGIMREWLKAKKKEPKS